MKRSILLPVTLVWLLVLMGLGYWSLRHGKATVKEQTTITSALPTVNAALGRIAGLLDPAQQVPVLGGYDRIGTTCNVTDVRSGQKYQRELDVYVAPGTEVALLARVRAQLPAGWKATLAGHQLDADAGDFVAVHGMLTTPGQITFTADTGCRPAPHPVVENTPPGDRTAVQSLLSVLHSTGTGWATHQLTCPSGGTLRTVSALAASPPGSVQAALRSQPGTVVLADGQRWAAGTGGRSGLVAVEQDSQLQVASTVLCQ